MVGLVKRLTMVSDDSVRLVAEWTLDRCCVVASQNNMDKSLQRWLDRGSLVYFIENGAEVEHRGVPVTDPNFLCEYADYILRQFPNFSYTLTTRINKAET